MASILKQSRIQWRMRVTVRAIPQDNKSYPQSLSFLWQVLDTFLTNSVVFHQLPASLHFFLRSETLCSAVVTTKPSSYCFKKVVPWLSVYYLRREYTLILENDRRQCGKWVPWAPRLVSSFVWFLIWCLCLGFSVCNGILALFQHCYALTTHS